MKAQMTGAIYDKSRGGAKPWKARVKIGGTSVHLGWYASAQEASAAFQGARAVVPSCRAVRVRRRPIRPRPQKLDDYSDMITELSEAQPLESPPPEPLCRTGRGFLISVATVPYAPGILTALSGPTDEVGGVSMRSVYCLVAA